MERLTQYFEVGAYTEKQNIIDVSNKLPLFENGVLMGKAIDRLAEFEDFMEENGIESLENLQTHINKINNYELGIRKQFVKEINEEEFFNMKDENQALKDMWQKLYDWSMEKGLSYLNGCIVATKMKQLEEDAFSNEYWYGVNREEKTILYSNGDGGIDLYDPKAFKFTDVKILENKSAIYFQYKVNGETKHIEISFAVLQKLLEGDNGRGF